MIPVESWDLDELAERWRSARPFPHVIVDEAVDAATLARLQEAASLEPHWPDRAELYELMASGESALHPTLQALEAELGSPQMRDAVHAISGRAALRVTLRSYVYRAGSYLLPHADSRAGAGRVVAYVLYIWTEDCDGGELELFACEMDGDEVIHARSAQLITPRTNRLVLFDVSNASLHQVREVLAGTRASLTGWFLA